MNYPSLDGTYAKPPDGNYFIELNAWQSSMAYQPICMVGSDTFDFQFYHHTRSLSTTDVIEFRFGIPTGLVSGSRTADTYSRQVIRGSTTNGAAVQTLGSTTFTSYAGTVNAASTMYASPYANLVVFVISAFMELHPLDQVEICWTISQLA